MILGKSYLGSTEIKKIYLGSVVVYESTPITSNLYSWSDAAAPTPNEANTINYDVAQNLGWYDDSSMIISIETTDTFNGGYAIKAENINGSNDRILLFMDNLTIGSSYRFSFYIKKVGTSDSQTIFNNGFTTSPTANFTTSWAEYTFDLEVASLPIRWAFYGGRAAGFAGDYILIDNISITEL